MQKAGRIYVLRIKEAKIMEQRTTNEEQPQITTGLITVLYKIAPETCFDLTIQFSKSIVLLPLFIFLYFLVSSLLLLTIILKYS